ncbi:MAG: hypothetical protein ACHQ4G_06635 [Opitutales bacterium]
MSNLPQPRATLTARHRNLFNGDSCVFFYNPEKWQPEDFSLREVDGKLQPVGGPFQAKAIDRFVENLAASGIDTFLVNPNASRAWYPSKVIPAILDGYRRGDREYFRGHAICQGVSDPAGEEKFIDRIMAFMNLYQDLLDAGVDWLAEAARACRRHRVSPWATIRMNDYHGHKNVQGSYFNLPLLKQPEMRLRRSGYSPTMFEPGYRTGLNYERSEVRALMLAQIKEVVEDYDYEGLELDWWRQPLCCEPDAAPPTVAMITDWMREIRALTDRRARQTGRPYPLGLRIPGQLETLKSIGLDVVTLCREGIIDFVAPSGFWCTTWEMPHDELRRKLGDRVAIYGVIEDGANPLPSRAPTLNHTQNIRFISSSREMLHANAAGKLVLGADGIEWFNFYCTDPGHIPGLISDYSSLRDIDRLDWLRGQPKHYAFSASGFGLVLPPFEITPQLPVILDKGWNHLFRLPMCAEPADRGLELVIQVVLKAKEAVGALPVSINGCWPRLDAVPTDRLLMPCGPLTHHTPEHRGYEYRFPVGLVRDGWNEISVENGGDQPITVVGIELAVRRTV